MVPADRCVGRPPPRVLGAHPLLRDRGGLHRCARGDILGA